MTHVLQAHNKMLWYFLFADILFSSVYKDNSVSRELKTGVCCANTNLTEAKNALVWLWKEH